MGVAYRFSFATWVRHVLCPQLEPYIVAAARSGVPQRRIAELVGVSDARISQILSAHRGESP